MPDAKDRLSPVATGGIGLPAGARRVLVVGAGRSGTGAALALAGRGVEVTVSDRRVPETIPGAQDLLRAGVIFVAEGAIGSCWPFPDLVIRSPGVPGEALPLSLAHDRGIPVWSELELAYALLPNPFSAITGTNGKTTTTALLGHLFATAGRPARVLGNIGVAVTAAVGEIEAGEEVVVEVSSFQLEDVHAFRPAVGVFLNLTPDHLDRHGTLQRYLGCKANLFVNQQQGDVAVLNAADPVVAALGEELVTRQGGPRVVLLSCLGPGCLGAVDGESDSDAIGSAGSGRRPAAGCMRPDSWVDEDWLYIEHEPILPLGHIQLPGRHNLENCLAAGTAAVARGIDREAVAEGLRTFAGVPHRLEMAGMIAGVTYVNDSKATNVEATLTALNAYPERTHLILGGRDKASDYRPVARACARGCKAVYLIGEATPLIEQAFVEVRDQEGILEVPQVQVCGDLEAAVITASKRAVSGDVVLLAPACASFDQYGSFEERGEHFRKLVARLGGSRP